MTMPMLLLHALVISVAFAQYCPTFHADFSRRQAAEPFNSEMPFNETHGAKHTPYITINGTKGTVKVGDGSPYHPMVASSDPDIVHFITHIYVLDQSGGFVAMAALDPSNASMAQMEFDIPSGATKLVAYEWCNKHGLWKGPEIEVSAASGAQAGSCQKPEIESSAQSSFIADLHRRQAAAPFNSPSPYNESHGAKHTPYISINGSMATVTVGDGSPFHPMVASSDPAVVHFVTLIYVLDQAGNVVAMENMDPTGVDKAVMTFTVPPDAFSLTAYEWCNKHGLWQGPTVQTPGRVTTTTTGFLAGEPLSGSTSAKLGAVLSFIVTFKLFMLL